MSMSMPRNVPIFRLSSSVIVIESPFVDKYLELSKNTRLCGWMCEWVWMSNVFQCCKYMAKNRQFQILEGKISAKARFFFEEGTRLGRVSVYFNLRSSVFVDVEVVFALRPSSRLVLKSRLCIRCTSRCWGCLSLNTRPCIDFNPYLDIRPSIRPTLR